MLSIAAADLQAIRQAAGMLNNTAALAGMGGVFAQNSGLPSPQTSLVSTEIRNPAVVTAI